MESKELRLWSVGVTEDDERLKILTDAAALAAFEKQQTLTSDFIENQLQGELIGRNTVGKLFNLDPKVIHIIIERPSEEHAPKRKLEEDKLDDILERLKAIQEGKTVVSISRMTQEHFMVLLDEHGFRRDTVAFSVIPTTKPIQSFTWGDKKEDPHAQGYLG
ncbi:hypothetical protein BC937DRAFT_86688 [Endogone sp. FLAS-F59071]|nr:hypothetical protein BC937DRAFT_86688 [Endogone sp. FLAS-F59071]|eukprot:RUS12926.1 hypothetical protein BC937DRAFT_86688 [Endogone sp. FLAS-F59071]